MTTSVVLGSLVGTLSSQFKIGKTVSLTNTANVLVVDPALKVTGTATIESSTDDNNDGLTITNTQTGNLSLRAKANDYNNWAISEILSYTASTPSRNIVAIQPKWSADTAIVALVPSAGKVGVVTANPSSALDVAGDVEIGGSNAFFIGDPSTNATWKIFASGNNLVAQQRLSGSYSTQGYLNSAYGQVYGGYSSSIGVTATTSNAKASIFDTNGISLNTTPSHTSDQITVLEAGVYLVTFHIAFTIGTDNYWVQWSAAVGGTASTPLSSKTNRVAGFAGVYSASFSGIVSLAANDVVTVVVKGSGPSNVSVDVYGATLSVSRIGA